MTANSASTAIPTWRAWIMAARPPTLYASIAPVLAGAGAAAQEEFRAGVFLATLASAVLLQIGANLANDYFDFQRGADASDRLGPQRVTQSGVIPPGRVLTATYLIFALAAAIGIYLVIEGGWPILLIGSLAILGGLAYTGGPLPYGYYGLGDVMVFAFFGIAAVTGAYYLQTDEAGALAFLTALPVGLTVTAILAANNLRDVETDHRAGKHTLAVFIGERATRRYYIMLITTPYLLLPLLLIAGAGPWLWLPVLSLPLALHLANTVLSGTRGRALNPVLKRTAQLHLLFGGLLALGLAL